jgi:hypothetical protein
LKKSTRNVTKSVEWFQVSSRIYLRTFAYKNQPNKQNKPDESDKPYMYKLKWHKDLAIRWHEFPRGQQILAIASELQRAAHFVKEKDNVEAKNAYERAFELLDLTISISSVTAERYELLRLREILGQLYFNEPTNMKLVKGLFDVLVSLNKDSFNALH